MYISYSFYSNLCCLTPLLPSLLFYTNANINAVVNCSSFTNHSRSLIQASLLLCDLHVWHSLHHFYRTWHFVFQVPLWSTTCLNTCIREESLANIYHVSGKYPSDISWAFSHIYFIALLCTMKIWPKTNQSIKLWFWRCKPTNTCRHHKRGNQQASTMCCLCCEIWMKSI